MTLNCRLMMGHAMRYLNKSTEENWGRMDGGQAKRQKSINEWEEKVQKSDRLRPVAGEIQTLFKEYASKMNEHRAQVLLQRQYAGRMNVIKDNLDKVCEEFGSLSVLRLKGQTRFSLKMIIWCILAAHAEQSASVAAEMNAQDREMKGFVNDLTILVEGRTQKDGEAACDESEDQMAQSFTESGLPEPREREA